MNEARSPNQCHGWRSLHFWCNNNSWHIACSIQRAWRTLYSWHPYNNHVRQENLIIPILQMGLLRDSNLPVACWWIHDSDEIQTWIWQCSVTFVHGGNSEECPRGLTTAPTSAQPSHVIQHGHPLVLLALSECSLKLLGFFPGTQRMLRLVQEEKASAKEQNLEPRWLLKLYSNNAPGQVKESCLQSNLRQTPLLLLLGMAEARGHRKASIYLLGDLYPALS